MNYFGSIFAMVVCIAMSAYFSATETAFSSLNKTRLKVLADNGNKAIFEVADNGCGIPEDALQKIFTGTHEKIAAPVDGTRSNMGIGLSVCAAIVKAHGSNITAKNKSGGGAVFSFALEREGEDDGQ